MKAKEGCDLKTLSLLGTEPTRTLPTVSGSSRSPMGMGISEAVRPSNQSFAWRSAPSTGQGSDGHVAASGDAVSSR